MKGLTLPVPIGKCLERYNSDHAENRLKAKCTELILCSLYICDFQFAITKIFVCKSDMPYTDNTVINRASY